MKKLTELQSFKNLEKHYNNTKNFHMRDLFEKDEQRGQRYFLETCGIKLDYSKNRINDETIKLLIDLANDSNLKEKINDMFLGKKINKTENRAVLHTALRNQKDKKLIVDNVNVIENIQNVLKKMGKFSDDVRNGKWLGYTNQIITDVVNIGIGGSDVGALMVCEALKNFGHTRLNMHFVSNVDGAQLQDVLSKVYPQTTLFIVSSKTFSTQETLTNAFTARKWFLKTAFDEKNISKHFVAVSTNKEAVKSFGIDENNMFEFWNWVGGRYSLWSAVGLAIMIYLGKENFQLLLEGAYEMDEHFKNTNFENNMPVILGLIGIWYINFYDAGSHLVVPYDQYLKHFPKFIQQLDMESNGKQVTNDGQKVNYDTGPILWGDMGINSQHAFFQLLHQGTHLAPIDFIVSLNTKETFEGHHEILLSNVFAQAEAFMKGRTIEESFKQLIDSGLDEIEANKLAPHRVFSGNRPNNLILLDEISPKTLGSLVALYEHKIFIQGVIWDINSFDQWGVELGKELAKNILVQLQGQENGSNHDSSTKNLINIYKKFNKLNK